MGKEKGNDFIIDSDKIGTDEKSTEFRLSIVKDFLENLDEKKTLVVGEMAVTLEGPYANIGMMVVEVKDNGIVRVAPAPNMPAIEMEESELWHFDDYYAGFQKALIEEQLVKSEGLQ